MNSLRVTNTKAQRSLRPAAMTMIEMAVVIGIMMALIGVLLIGYRFYVENCQRCECLVLQSQVQKQYRSYCSINLNKVAHGIPVSTLIAAGIAGLQDDKCPSGGTRVYMGESAPLPLGQRVFPCQGVAAIEHAPEAKDLASW